MTLIKTSVRIRILIILCTIYTFCMLQGGQKLRPHCLIAV